MATAGIVTAPFTIAIDTREQRPYTFAGIRDNSRSVSVARKVTTLHSGDYSIVGCETEIAIERKSKADLFGTLGKGRERFERELQRLNGGEYKFALILVECEWSEVFEYPPARSKLSPKVVFRTVNAWEQRYRGVHWSFMPSRELAEVKAYRCLERFWKVSADKKQTTSNNE